MLTHTLTHTLTRKRTHTHTLTHTHAHTHCESKHADYFTTKGTSTENKGKRVCVCVCLFVMMHDRLVISEPRCHTLFSVFLSFVRHFNPGPIHRADPGATSGPPSTLIRAAKAKQQKRFLSTNERHFNILQ